MPDNTSQYKSVFGEAFSIKPQDDKTNFCVRSYISNNIVNCTLWHNSHGHVELAQGDVVVVNGKITTKPKDNGDGHWVNLSVGRIAVIPMDAGLDTRNEPAASVGASDDDPDVL